jgi:hypothetical protein
MNKEGANSLPHQESNAGKSDLPFDILNLESTAIKLHNWIPRDNS